MVRSCPSFQLIPMPFLRRPVMTETVIESPVAAFQLSLTAMLCSVPPVGSMSDPRLPGQQGVVWQFAPLIVPSTNIVIATEPGNIPKIGAGTPVVTGLRQLA